MEKRTCHPHKVSHKKNKSEIVLTVSSQQLRFLQSAADQLTKGCLCDLVSNLFWDAFEDLTKSIAEEIAKEESKRKESPVN